MEQRDFIEACDMDWESLYCPNRRGRCYGHPFAQGQLAKHGSRHGQKQARCGAYSTYVSIRYGTAYLDLYADAAIFETAVRTLAPLVQFFNIFAHGGICYRLRSTVTK